MSRTIPVFLVMLRRELNPITTAGLGFATRIGISYRSLRYYLRGERIPSAIYAKRIADALPFTKSDRLKFILSVIRHSRGFADSE